MNQDDKAKIIIDLIIPLQEKMIELDIKEFKTQLDDISIEIKLDKTDERVLH